MPPRLYDQLPIAPGLFQPTTTLLKTYQYPEWFRDAKLGMWAHWGPQAVPMFGDWYARQLYQQGGSQYKDHLEHYGHPTKLGYKDLIPLWKAEKWDHDRLMALYKKAGARYFVSMGVHHDNFDLWNSTHHKWNAVKMGPHRDVGGDWQKAAKKLGLRLGVSEHLGASFTWFQDSHRWDKTGPLAGVPYDGADPKYQDLYHFPAAPDDKGWYSKDPRWHLEWFARIKDLVDQYHPDLLYTDGGVPFGNEVGLSMIAHHYNTSAGRNDGKPDVVYTCKQNSEGMWVEDLERGVMPGIRPFPRQTDTSIGDWYYNRNWKYRGADWVIHMLVDIVSKNGNLPEQKPCNYAVALKISGENFRGFKPELAAPAASLVQPGSSGTLALTTDDAELQGSTIKVEEKEGHSNIGFWDKLDESASWKVKFKQPGKYNVTASIAALSGDALAVVEVAGGTVELKPSATGSWDKFSEIEAGTIEISQAGEQTVKVRPRDAQTWKPINLRWVKLSHVGS